MRQLQQQVAKFFGDSHLVTSAFALTLWKGLNLRIENEIDFQNESLRTIIHEALSPEYEQQIPQSENEVIQESINLWQRALEQLRKLCEGNGVIYLHALQPNQYLENSKTFTDIERNVAIKEDVLRAYQLIPRHYAKMGKLGEKLKSEGENFIDLT